MAINFDQVIDRRAISNVNKWKYYPPDVLPLWVADMDFRSPEPILAALRGALEHGILGYELPGEALLQTVANRMESLYAWKISPEMVIPVPGVGAGMVITLKALTNPGDGVIVQPPIFPPFLHFPPLMGRVAQEAMLKPGLRGGNWYYEPDLEAFNRAVEDKTAPTKMFLLCNPHNPTGRTFTLAELAGMAEICIRHNVLICSDEIHHGVLLNGQEHIPIASLSPEIEKNSITFIGPGKTFNMSGMHCAFAIIPDAGLREKVRNELAHSALEVNNLGLAAANVAYSGACDAWMLELREYLRANRDFAVEFIRSELPGLKSTVPEGTFLLWIDCSSMMETGRI